MIFLSWQETQRKASEPLPAKIWPPLPESNGIPSEKGPGPPTLGWTSPKVGEEEKEEEEKDDSMPSFGCNTRPVGYRVQE